MINNFFIFLKRHLLFAVLGLLLVGALFLVFKTFLKERSSPSLSTTPITPLKIAGKTIPEQVDFTPGNVSLSKQLPVYRGLASHFSEEQAIKIAQEFDFNSTPLKVGNSPSEEVLSWSSDKTSLNIDLGSPAIDYSLNLLITRGAPKEGSLPSPDQALTFLDDLLARIGQKPSLTLAPQKEHYLVLGQSAFLETTPQTADFIQIGLNPSMREYPLLGRDLNQPNIFLILGRGGQIVRFRYELYFSRFSEEKPYPLKNISHIADSLVQEGKIVSFDLMSEEAWALEFTSAAFTKINLGYFQPSNKEEVIQPVYILSGTGVLSDGRKTTITAYLPAIAY